MSTGPTLFLSLFIIISIAGSIYYYLSIQKKKNKLSIENEWLNFTAAAERKDVQDLNTLGNILVWNTALSSKRLCKMSEIVDLHFTNTQSLGELKNIIDNKLLSFARKDDLEKFGHSN
jgi:hypothetical protein